MVRLQLSFICVENANVNKWSKSKPFFQGKLLGVRVCKNCLMDVKPLPILWQTEIKPARSGSAAEHRIEQFPLLPSTQDFPLL